MTTPPKESRKRGRDNDDYCSDVSDSSSDNHTHQKVSRVADEGKLDTSGADADLDLNIDHEQTSSSESSHLDVIVDSQLDQVSIDEGDSFNCSSELAIDEHLKAAELVDHKFNDTDASEINLQSENDKESNINFNISDYLHKVSSDEEDSFNCSSEVTIDGHLKAAELIHDKLNDTDASENILKSENDKEYNINFNTSDYLHEQMGDLPHNQDSSTTNCYKEMDRDIHSDVTCIVKTVEEGIFIDETTRDCEELPHISSTPFKQDDPSVSLSDLKKLTDLISKIPPITFEESDSNISSDSNSDYSTYSDSDNQEDSFNSTDEDGEDNDDCREINVSRHLIGLGENLNESESAFEPEIDQNLNDSASDAFNNIQGLPDDVVSKSCILNNVKLYPSSDLSVNQSILTIMDLFLKNKLSKAGLSRTLRVMCSFLPEGHNLPSTSSKILQYIESLAPPVSATVHYCCESCLYYHGDKITGPCEICKVESNFQRFYIFDVATLVKFFFESRNLAAIIDADVNKRHNSDPMVLKNVKDGSAYKSINSNREKYDITLIFASDGVRIRKGSKKELWLAMFSIAELPIHLQKSFLTVVGVWYNTKKPDMRTFLKPFVQSMESLDHTGVKWIHPISKEVHSSCVRLLVSVLDAPARAMVQNTMMFNGRYGCNICEIKSQKSKPLPDVKRRPRVYNYIHNIPLRTKERMLKQAIEACELNVEHVRGVKGPSILTTIPSVDISKCIVPEYLHSVLIGCVKQLLTIWTEEKGDWSLKGKISEIDAFLCSFKHPDFIHRQVRQLKSLSHWKASDYYYFLLFEAVPSLHGILPNKYYQHLLLLVKAIFILLKSEITKSDLKESELLLKLFVADFGNLYGDRAQTHNVHQLLHLTLCVQLYGPLFCWSAFPFEDLNGVIAKATHGTNYVDTEIVNNIIMCQGIQMLRNIVRGHHGLTELSSTFCQGELLGKEVKRSLLSSEELDVLHDPTAAIYSRAKIGFDVYTSQTYKSSSSENFNVSWTGTNGTNYGSIKYFAQSRCDKFLVVDLFSVDQTQLFYHEKTQRCIEHFIPVKSSNSYAAIRFSDIASSIVKVGKIKNFIYLRPNLYRFVM